LAVANLSSLSFDLFYKISNLRNEEPVNIVFAKTGMICFDYKARKIVQMPEALKEKLEMK